MQNYNRIEPASQTAFPIARPGVPFIAAAAFATAVLALLGLTSLTLLGLITTVFICYFFRDPDRVIPDVPSAIVSPADGKIIRVEQLQQSPYTTGSCSKISIFMSVFNVHVNRIPFDGLIKQIAYYPGKFFSANLDKASRLNEHNAIYLQTDKDQDICFVQIAGLVARRIICNIQEGDTVVRGQRFGLICFGSRLDVYLPENASIMVNTGDVVKAGTSVIGKLS